MKWLRESARDALDSYICKRFVNNAIRDRARPRRGFVFFLEATKSRFSFYRPVRRFSCIIFDRDDTISE